VNGETISISAGEKSFRAYLSRPAQDGGPALIVIQEWWGLVPHIMDVCDRFAAEGFTALAPDLYDGKTADEPSDAGTLLMALNIAETEVLLRAAVKHLAAITGKEKVGVIGYCMGGQLSLFAAATNSQIAAAADYYGIHPNVHPDLENLQGPVLGIFAEHDNYAPAEAVQALDAALTAHGKSHEFHTYPGTQHAFFNDTGRGYNAVAAADAWAKTIAFFKQNLA